MTTTLKQFQGSLVDPKDDAKVYQFLGGVSGVVVGCVATLYATNQLKVSDGWGFACGRVFVIEEEIVVANTAAAKGRIIVNIDLENVAEPAALTTQSAAVLPALVQEDINADGTVFQLALAQYNINNNIISNLTDARVMLHDVDSRLSAKQAKITNTANQLFYGSGTAGSLNQLTSPSISGSVLRQNTSGAPYWSTDLLKRNSFIVASASATEAFTAGDNHIVTFNSVLQENDPLNILSVSNNNIVCAQAATVMIGVSIDLAANGVTSGAIADGHLMLRVNNVSSTYYQRFLCAGGHDNMLNMFPIVLTLSAGDAIGVKLYNPFTCTLGRGTTKRFWMLVLN